MAEIAGCSCGNDHEFMPTDMDFSCDCIMFSWLPEDEWEMEEGCEHPMFEFDLVCRTHKRHIPCRECRQEKS